MTQRHNKESQPNDPRSIPHFTSICTHSVTKLAELTELYKNIALVYSIQALTRDLVLDLA